MLAIANNNDRKHLVIAVEEVNRLGSFEVKVAAEHRLLRLIADDLQNSLHLARPDTWDVVLGPA